MSPPRPLKPPGRGHAPVLELAGARVAVVRGTSTGHRWPTGSDAPDPATAPDRMSVSEPAHDRATLVAATRSLPGPSVRVGHPRNPFQRWLEARLAPTDTWVLGQRNIYILPTRAGFAFALTLVLMLLASINYQLNLGYALTFLLAGAGLVSMHLTHGTLRGLTLNLRPPAPGFAGDAVPLLIVATNPNGRSRHGIGLRLRLPADAAPDRAVVWTDVPALGQASLHISTVPAQRGWHAVPPLLVETVFPFGLFRAWSVWRPVSRVLAWPAPEPAAPPLPRAAAVPGERPQPRRADGGETDGVRPWRRGDSMRQVAWKKVARSGEMVSRDTAGEGSRSLWLDWSATAAPGAGAEARLSRLAAWVLAADGAGLQCGVRLPGHELPPDAGDAHRRRALDLLATWA